MGTRNKKGMTTKSPGVCKAEDCALDAVYGGMCPAHCGEVHCTNCGRMYWDHVTIAPYRLCPTAFFEVDP